MRVLELSRFPIELGKNLDFGAEHFRHDGDRNVVDGAHLVAPQPIHVGEMNGRDEDDRGLLAARMVPDHCRQLEPIELRHTYIHENHRDFVLEQGLKGLPSGASL